MKAGEEAALILGVSSRTFRRYVERYEEDPFTLRRHFMKTMCEKAGVKPFGFHALRHKAAEIVYLAGGKSNEAQALLGHAQASTTNRYLKSAGLYADKSEVVNAIMGNSVGQAAADMLKKAIAPKAATSEAICKR